MRRMTGVLSAVAVLAVTISAQGKFNLRIAAANGKAAANLPVYMSMAATATPIGTTSADGDLDIASDPNKNGKSYNVYRMDCSRIVLLEDGSADDQSCKKQSAQNPPPQNGCGGCVPMGAFVFGRSSMIGHFAGDGSAWKNPWVITTLVGTGIAVPVIATQSGGSSQAPTAVAGPAPTQPSAPAPVPAPAPPPAPVPTFPNITNRNINLTATPGSQNSCNLFLMNFLATGHLTVDSSGFFIVDYTDATNQTVTLRGPATINNAQTATFGMSQPFDWTSATSQRNLRATAISGEVNATGVGRLTANLSYRGGGSSGPAIDCIDQRIFNFQFQ